MAATEAKRYWRKSAGVCCWEALWNNQLSLWMKGWTAYNFAGQFTVQVGLPVW